MATSAIIATRKIPSSSLSTMLISVARHGVASSLAQLPSQLSNFAAIRRAPSQAHNEIFSFSVASSSGARELLTRFDTGHFCSTFSAAGLSNSRPAHPLSHGS